MFKIFSKSSRKISSIPLTFLTDRQILESYSNCSNKKFDIKIYRINFSFSLRFKFWIALIASQYKIILFDEAFVYFLMVCILLWHLSLQNFTFWKNCKKWINLISYSFDLKQLSRPLLLMEVFFSVVFNTQKKKKRITFSFLKWKHYHSHYHQVIIKIKNTLTLKIFFFKAKIFYD